MLGCAALEWLTTTGAVRSFRGSTRRRGISIARVRTGVHIIIAFAALALCAVPAVADGSSEWVSEPVPSPAALYSALEGVSCPSASSCTAVGFFTTIDGTTMTLAERFDGTRWSIQRTPNPPNATTSSLDAVTCVSRVWCTAVGTFTRFDGTEEPLAEHFDGTRWLIEPTPEPSGALSSALLGVACASANGCIATGVSQRARYPELTMVEHFDGARWSIQPDANPSGRTDSRLTGVSCTSSRSCSAVGLWYLPDRSSAEVPLAEHLSGTRWSIQRTPNPDGSTYGQFGGVACAPHDCTAVGFDTDPADAQVPLAEHLSGTRWSIQTAPIPIGATTSGLNAISCVSTSRCAAVGFTSSPYHLELTLAEVMVGDRWTIEPTPNPIGPSPRVLLAVSCQRVMSCTAVGFSTNPDGTSVALVERS